MFDKKDMDVSMNGVAWVIHGVGFTIIKR